MAEILVEDIFVIMWSFTKIAKIMTLKNLEIYGIVALIFVGRYHNYYKVYEANGEPMKTNDWSYVQ